MGAERETQEPQHSSDSAFSFTSLPEVSEGQTVGLR